MSACIRSQMAYAVGRITMVPRTGPLSASSALEITSWYQRGKSSARGVSTRAIADDPTGGPDRPRCCHPLRATVGRRTRSTSTVRSAAVLLQDRHDLAVPALAGVLQGGDP